MKNGGKNKSVAFIILFSVCYFFISMFFIFVFVTSVSCLIPSYPSVI